MLTSGPHTLKLELQRRLAGPLHKAGMQINELSYSFVKETVHWFILTETTSVAVLCPCDICLLSYFLLLGLFWWWSCPLLISRNGWSLTSIQYILFFFKILTLSGPGNVDVGELAPLLARVEWESWSCPSLTEALRRVGTAPHLDSLVELGLGAVGAGELAPMVLESWSLNLTACPCQLSQVGELPLPLT